MQSQKQQNDLCSFPSQTIQYHNNPVCAPTSNAEEAEAEWLYEDRPSRANTHTQKDVLFIIGDWNAKVGSHEIPGGSGLVTKSCLTLATPWTIACQAPLSMGFSRQEY